MHSRPDNICISLSAVVCVTCPIAEEDEVSEVSHYSVSQLQERLSPDCFGATDRRGFGEISGRRAISRDV